MRKRLLSLLQLLLQVHFLETLLGDQCRTRRTRTGRRRRAYVVFIVVWRFLGFCAAFREDGVEALVTGKVAADDRLERPVALGGFAMVARGFLFCCFLQSLR
jgi:hypothetical protein